MNSETLAKLNDKSIAEMRDNLKREIAAHQAIVNKLHEREHALRVEQLRRQLESESEATK